MNTENAAPAQKSLKEIAESIAEALGQEWSRSTRFDLEDGSRQWRARLEGPGVEALFISNTWGPRGMLSISGWVPDDIDRQSVRLPEMAHINVSLSKTPEQMAREIQRRLLPEYRKQLAEVLKAHAADLEWKDGVRKTKQRVVEIIGGLLHNDSEIVVGRGSTDIQVCGPDSLRFSGHCLYFSTEQLKKIYDAVPELFEKQS